MDVTILGWMGIDARFIVQGSNRSLDALPNVGV